MRPPNEKKKSYTDLGELRPPPRASKVLTPNVVATTVAVLLLSSIIGIVIAIAVFSIRTSFPGYLSASEASVVIASSVSILYLFLHYFAAIHNKAVGLSRPPQHKTHALCFIVARLALVAWIIALITSSVVVSKKPVCPGQKTTCRLQIVNVVASALAFLSCGIILTALESCQHPFKAPRVCTGITCRVSSFDDVIIDRPVSTASSVIVQEKSSQSGKIIWQNNIQRKPVPNTSIPGDFPEGSLAKLSGRNVTPLSPPLGMKSPRKSWGEEWKHLAEAAEVKPTTLSKSLSLNSTSSIGSLSIISNSEGSLTHRQGRTRTVTPSSSISNLSRRSPLSKMRSVEFPDVIVYPELYVLPPKIPPPHEWSTTQTETLQQLLPIVDVRVLQRQASGMQRRPSAMVAPLAIRKYARHPPPSRHPSLIRNQPLSRHQSLRQPLAGGLVRRTTLDVRVPGAYIDYRLSREEEAKVNEHARKIEVESRNIVSSQSGRACKPSVPVPRSLPRVSRGETNGIFSPTRFNSMTRYRDPRPQWPGPQRCNTVCGLKQHPPDIAYPSRSATTSVKKLRRLTLGDIDVDLGKLWEEV